MSRNVIEIVIRASNQAQAVLKNTGDYLTRIGGELALIGTIASAALGLATQAALTYNQSITDTASILRLTQTEQARLSDQLNAFGATTRAGPQAVAESYYEIVSAVADTSVHMATLEAAVRTAEAGNANLVETTGAVVSVMNSYGFAAEQAGFVSDVLSRTVAVGVGTMNQFAAALPQVTGLASFLKIPLEEVGAALAYITTKGFTTGQAATQVEGALRALINPTGDMEKLLRAMGFQSGQAALAQLGLAGTFRALNVASQQQNISLSVAIGRAEAYQGAITLMSDAATAALGNFVSGIEGATQAARDIQLQNPAAQFDFLKSAVEAVRIEAGEALVGALVGVAQAVTPVLLAVLTWAQANPKVTQTVLLLVAAVSAIGPAMFIAGQATNFLNAAMTALTGPWGLAIKIAILLAAAIITNFGGVRDIFARDLMPLLVAFGNLFGALYNALKPLLKAIFDLFSGVFGAIFDLLRPFISFITDIIRLVTSLIKLITGDFVGSINTFTQATGQAFPLSPAQQAQQAAIQRAQQGFANAQQNNANTAALANLPPVAFPPGVGLPANFGGVSYSNDQAALFQEFQQLGLNPTIGANGQIITNPNTTINVTMPAGVETTQQAQQLGLTFGQGIANELRLAGVTG
jgi:TP901 family phage tail tape measure protein